ncbi:SCO-spondin-like [Haliotis rufescens]|uniref:SCO-spondin-like n=1 Tax=Haliotis rufescens TaxID=6454 RepID=UPI00201ED726|nr:SCO-spondin-like [Haliotis rufescens]
MAGKRHNYWHQYVVSGVILPRTICSGVVAIMLHADDGVLSGQKLELWCPSTGQVVNGSFSQWSEWTQIICPKTCGVDVETLQRRSRACDNPPSFNGGLPCDGSTSQERNWKCTDLSPCPVDGGVSEWGEWDTPRCPTCGENVTGVSLRLRQCDNPVPANGGSFCIEPVQEIVVRSCEVARCPVDGRLSNWTSWSIVPCPVTCGVDAMTNQSRHRDCNAPAPEAGGKNCTGPLTETSDDNVTEWSQWSAAACTATCGPGQEGSVKRSRSCITPANNISCTAELIETQMGNCDLPKCPVDGGLSNWTSWSIVPCPVTCGADAMTNQSRRRDCNAPAPEAGGKNCTGPLTETSQTHCNVPPCSGDDNVTEWSQWSAAACTATCGPGQEGSVKRSKSCITPANNISCTAELIETQMGNCDLPKCPVDGGLSNWTSWSIVPCPVTCGADAMTNQSRRRDCNAPAPEAGGKNCTGPLTETSQTHCNVPPCSGDDNVTEWSQWSAAACTATCGPGQEGSVKRSRSCITPANNISCTAELIETQMGNCDLPKCPVDGGLSNWTSWSIVPCPVTCGADAMTNQSRRRDCNAPAPEAGGKNCTGPLTETSQTHCNVSPCSGDDNVTEWSQWSAAACTATCGPGQEGSVKRSRSCITPANNISCTAELIETQMGNCDLPKCPVDGGLSNWTSWSIVPCPVTCGADAMTNQSRRRDCNAPAPEAGGKNCTGPLTETSQTHCNVPPCSGDDNVTEWSQWSAAACTATCGPGQEGSVKRSRSCITPANNISCTAELIETQMGNCDLPKCPVDGGLSNWTSWSIVPCPVTCGADAMTNQSRRRDCNAPAPEAGGKNCTGPLTETSQTHCNVPPCSGDDNVTEWSQWSAAACTATCGPGQEGSVKRSKSCITPANNISCTAELIETQMGNCDLPKCPVDGGLSNWTSWSIVPCPVTCGADAMTNQSRRRDCNAPAPEAGGKNCTGPLTETSQTHCNVPPCSGDDNVTEWSQWSAAACTATCGPGQEGSVKRSRSCITPANNISCTAELIETQMGNCDLPKCPVDGGLSNWTSWSIVPCPVTCGADAMTNQSRRRDCNAPAPEAGGKNCTGPLTETSQTHCNVPPCSGDDNVTEWSQWSAAACTATCGPGQEGSVKRSKSCITPANNISCTAELIETQMGNCDLPKCPVDGGLSNWTSWSIVPCPVTCGADAMTNQSRRRDCNAPAPEAGGKNCTGPLTETSQTHCNVPPCSGDDNVTEWSQWSAAACTATCGPGQEGSVKRSRSCITPANNISCTAELIETQMGNCDLPKCPVDGGLSNWTSWSIVPCPVTCGADAMTNQSRRRDCNAPAPEAGGKNCTGPLTETSQTHCNVPPCSGDDNVTEWSQWSAAACTATCGPGQEGSVKRSRSCITPANNISCTAELIETQMGNCDLPKCPVDGGLSNWTSWSIVPCPVTCGADAMTNQSRRRDCNAPAPEAGGKNCTGPLTETSQTHCNVPPCSGDDNVTEWSQWSAAACTATCGPGQEGSVKRSRSCITPANNISCTAELIETQIGNCDLPKCPVDGGLSNWTSWSIVPCPVTCGADAMTNQSRRRDCNAPAPEASGKNCTGPLTETSQTHCNVPPCSGT